MLTMNYIYFKLFLLLLSTFYHNVQSINCPFNCSGPTVKTCPFNDQCTCQLDSINDQFLVSCGTCNRTLTNFPTFSYYNTMPIKQITVVGSFTEIDDNAFYLLNSMTGSSVCIEHQNSIPTVLTTYDNTF